MYLCECNQLVLSKRERESKESSRSSVTETATLASVMTVTGAAATGAAAQAVQTTRKGWTHPWLTLTKGGLLIALLLATFPYFVASKVPLTN